MGKFLFYAVDAGQVLARLVGDHCRDVAHGRQVVHRRLAAESSFRQSYWPMAFFQPIS
jgi:hypothetical protein